MEKREHERTQIGNPIIPGYYADPEARFYEGEYWIYATQSRPFPEQKNVTAFSSKDMRHWEKHEDIIAMEGFPWIWGAVWAPTVIQRDGKYFMIFSSNDIHSSEEPGGLEIAVSDSPGGPFRGWLGHPLVEDIYQGAQPIDAHLFEDSDGTVYLYYGGWGHCIVSVMNSRMDGFLPFEDGALRREVTPPEYVEGPCMIKEGEKYYFLWSSGKWEESSYCVYYGMADSPLATFEKQGVVVESQEALAKAPGHNGYYYIPEKEEYYLVYHRRGAKDTARDARQLCIDRMYVEEGGIRPVVMT